MSTAIPFIVVFLIQMYICFHTYALSLFASLKFELPRPSASWTSCNDLQVISSPSIITSGPNPKKKSKPGNRNLLLLRSLFQMFLTRCSVIKKLYSLSLVIDAQAVQFFKMLILQVFVCQNVCCVVITHHSFNLPKNKNFMWRITFQIIVDLE